MPPGQCRKSHGPSRRSCPSTIARQRPESTRKPSWVSSRWYMQAGSPGWSTPTWKPTSGKRTSPWKLRSEPPKPGLCCHWARLALSTYQPSPRGTSPCSVVSILASVMAVVSRRVPRFTSNPALRPEAVADPSADAAAFHVRIPGWRETPVRQLDGVARELGLAGVAAQGRVGPARAARVQGARRLVGGRARAARGAGHAHAGRRQRRQPRPRGRPRGGDARPGVPDLRARPRRRGPPRGDRGRGRGGRRRRRDLRGRGAPGHGGRRGAAGARARGRRRLRARPLGHRRLPHAVRRGRRAGGLRRAARARGGRIVRRRRGPLRRARGQGRDRGRAVERGLRGRLARGGLARRRGDARDADGRDGLRRGLPRGLAVAARRAGAARSP